MDRSESLKNLWLPAGVVLLVFLFYGLGTFFPDAWWGLHFLAFLPGLWQAVILGLAGGLFAFALYRSPKRNSFWVSMETFLQTFGVWLIVGLSLLMGFLFYTYPIVADNYGDAFQYQEFLDQSPEMLPGDYWQELFSPDLSPGKSRKVRAYTISAWATVFGIPIKTVFTWLNVLSGIGFVACWLWWVHCYLEDVGSKVILAICGLMAPFTLMFYGHIETYSPVFLLILIWLIGLVSYLEKPNLKILWGLLLLWLLCIKVHPLSFLLGPAQALLFVKHFAGRQNWAKRLLRPRGLLLFVVLPTLLAGMILYFGVFEDYKDERVLQGIEDLDRLFLPILSPEPPLDRYNLFSWNHFFDFFNVLWWWSPLALIGSATLTFLYRKEIDWESLDLLLLGLSLVLFCLLLFAINPLVSMPIDWDLFCLPAPILLVSFGVLLKTTQVSLKSPSWIPLFCGIGILSLPVFIVNASAIPLAYRMESIGIHIFKTYYEKSDIYLLDALNRIPNDPETYLEREARILADLKPLALKGDDYIYANLLMDHGYYYLRELDQFSRAAALFEEAAVYDPEKMQNRLFLMEAQFQMKEYHKAYQTAHILIQNQYPDQAKSLRIGIHCALEAGLYEEALIHSQTYLQEIEELPLIRTVHDRLLNGIEPESLKTLFRTQK